MNTPNKLTVLRIILAPLYLLLLMIDFPHHYLVAGLVFGAAALTDMFDGKIARKYNLITNFGKFLDPLADKMLTTAAFLGFLAMDRIDVWAVMLILTREFMVTSVRLLAAKDGNVIAASFAGKLKTVMQFVAIIFMMVALEWQSLAPLFPTVPAAAFGIPLTVGHVLAWVSVVFTMISGFEYVWNCRKYFSDAK